jgi:hypothetical protein
MKYILSLIHRKILNSYTFRIYMKYGFDSQNTSLLQLLQIQNVCIKDIWGFW